jgi:opacity protein-like surface antigen
MKNISRLVGIAALAALPAMAQAQGTTTSRPVSFGVSAGASIPTGDFGDAVDVGYTVGANVMLAPASLRMLAFRGDVTFDSWKYKADLFDGNARALGVMANVIVRPGTAMSIKPYAIGGVGLVNTKSKFSEGGVSVSTDSKSNFGAQVGGGLEFQLSGFTTFIEAKFTTVFAGDDDSNTNTVNTSNSSPKAHWIPVTFGIRF